jgi:hypothetical protein
MIIIIQAAENGVFIKQDTSDACHVYEKPNRAPRAAARKVKELLDNFFENTAEPEGEEGAGDGE